MIFKFKKVVNENTQPTTEEGLKAAAISFLKEHWLKPCFDNQFLGLTYTVKYENISFNGSPYGFSIDMKVIVSFPDKYVQPINWAEKTLNSFEDEDWERACRFYGVKFDKSNFKDGKIKASFIPLFMNWIEEGRRNFAGFDDANDPFLERAWVFEGDIYHEDSDFCFVYAYEVPFEGESDFL